MLIQLLTLPVLIGISIFLLATVAVGLVSYFVARALIHKPVQDERKNVADSLFRISGALLGLLLSLTFASIREDITKLRDSVELEAAQIADIFNDLARFESEDATALQQKVVDYTRALIEHEWPLLSAGGLSPQAWDIYEDIELGLLDLKTEGPRQESLRSRLLQDIDEISDHRQARLYTAKDDPPFFLYIAMFGFVATMLLFCVHPPSVASIVFLSLFSVFVGTVMYFSFALSHPFDGALSVSPKALELIYGDFLSGTRT